MTENNNVKYSILLNVFISLTFLISGCSSSETGLSGDHEKKLGEEVAQFVNVLRGNKLTIPEKVTDELDTQKFPEILNQPRPRISSEVERKKMLDSLMDESVNGKKALAILEKVNDISQPVAEYSKMAGPISPADAHEIPSPPEYLTHLRPTDIPPSVKATFPLDLSPPSVAGGGGVPSLPSTQQLVKTDFYAVMAEPDRKISTIDVPKDFHQPGKNVVLQSLANSPVRANKKSTEIGSLHFESGTYELTGERGDVLDQAIHQAKKNKGTLRVFAELAQANDNAKGLASRNAMNSLAQGRAEVVGRELVRMGVPVEKIYVGVVEVEVEKTSGDIVKIFIDY